MMAPVDSENIPPAINDDYVSSKGNDGEIIATGKGQTSPLRIQKLRGQSLDVASSALIPVSDTNSRRNSPDVNISGKFEAENRSASSNTLSYDIQTSEEQTMLMDKYETEVDPQEIYENAKKSFDSDISQVKLEGTGSYSNVTCRKKVKFDEAPSLYTFDVKSPADSPRIGCLEESDDDDFPSHMDPKDVIDPNQGRPLPQIPNAENKESVDMPMAITLPTPDIGSSLLTGEEFNYEDASFDNQFVNQFAHLNKLVSKHGSVRYNLDNLADDSTESEGNSPPTPSENVFTPMSREELRVRAKERLQKSPNNSTLGESQFRTTVPQSAVLKALQSLEMSSSNEMEFSQQLSQNISIHLSSHKDVEGGNHSRSSTLELPDFGQPIFNDYLDNDELNNPGTPLGKIESSLDNIPNLPSPSKEEIQGSPVSIAESEKTIRNSELKTRKSLASLNIPLNNFSSAKRMSDNLTYSPDSYHQPLTPEVVSPFKGKPILDLDVCEDKSFFSEFGKEYERRSEKITRGYITREHSTIIQAVSNSVNDEEPQKMVLPPISSPNKISTEPLVKPSIPPKNSNIPKQLPLQPQPPSNKMISIPVKPRTPSKPPTVSPRKELVEETSTPIQSQPQQLPDRGRLFVRLMSLRDLKLPLPDGSTKHFSCTLDNGVHSITTPWSRLGYNSLIDQEFEFLVQNDLQFMLTLKMNVDDNSKDGKARSKSGFGKLISSPKKFSRSSLMNDSLMSSIGRDGTFGQCAITFGQIRERCYGKLLTTTIDCTNRWATEPPSSPGKGKKDEIMRKKPYTVGSLQLQLFFVPGVSTQENPLPKSIEACMADLRIAKWYNTILLEGFLSQSGADCKLGSKRRYFILKGPKLIAHHEFTMQGKLSIDLKKAVLLYSSQTQNREEETGEIFGEENFRIKFSNGDYIDFSSQESQVIQQWVSVLKGIIGSVPKLQPWTESLEKQSNSTPRLLNISQIANRSQNMS